MFGGGAAHTCRGKMELDMFITFIEQFVKLPRARAESNYSYVCKRCHSTSLVSKMGKKGTKKDLIVVFLLAGVKFETQ